MTEDNGTATEFARHRAARAFRALDAKFHQLPPESQESLVLLLEALLVATDEEAQHLLELVETRPVDVKAVVQASREVLGEPRPHGFE